MAAHFKSTRDLPAGRACGELSPISRVESHNLSRPRQPSYSAAALMQSIATSANGVPETVSSQHVDDDEFNNSFTIPDPLAITHSAAEAFALSLPSGIAASQINVVANHVELVTTTAKARLYPNLVGASSEPFAETTPSKLARAATVNTLTPTANLKLLSDAVSAASPALSSGEVATKEGVNNGPLSVMTRVDMTPTKQGTRDNMEEVITPTANLHLLGNLATSVLDREISRNAALLQERKAWNALGNRVGTDRALGNRVGADRALGNRVGADRALGNLVGADRAGSKPKRGRPMKREDSAASMSGLSQESVADDGESEDEEGRARGMGAHTSRKEKSLGLLCYKFIGKFEEYPPETANHEVCLDAIAKELGVERRRIYDIVNVLESVHMMSRRAKNRYLWHGKTKLVFTLVKLKNLAVKEQVQEQLDLVKAYEKSRHQQISANPVTTTIIQSAAGRNGKLSAPGTILTAIKPKGTTKGWKPPDTEKKSEPQNEYLTKFLEKFGSQIKREKSLGIMSQKFLMLFLTDSSIINLDIAAKILIGDPTIESRNSNAKFKTKIRRLYDIANILTSLNLIRKRHMPGEGRGRKPAFEYIGPDYMTAYENMCLDPKFSTFPTSYGHYGNSLSLKRTCSDGSFMGGNVVPMRQPSAQTTLCQRSGVARTKAAAFTKHASLDSMCQVVSTERNRVVNVEVTTDTVEVTTDTLPTTVCEATVETCTDPATTAPRIHQQRQFMLIRDRLAADSHSSTTGPSSPSTDGGGDDTCSNVEGSPVGKERGGQLKGRPLQQVTLIPVSATAASLLNTNSQQVVFRAKLVEDSENGVTVGQKRHLGTISEVPTGLEPKRLRSVINDENIDPVDFLANQQEKSAGKMETNVTQACVMHMSVTQMSGDAKDPAQGGLARPQPIRQSPTVSSAPLGSLDNAINCEQVGVISRSLGLHHAAPVVGRTALATGLPMTPMQQQQQQQQQLHFQQPLPSAIQHRRGNSVTLVADTSRSLHLSPSVDYLRSPLTRNINLLPIHTVSPLAGGSHAPNSGLLPSEAFLSPAAGGMITTTTTTLRTPSTALMGGHDGGQPRRRVVYHTPGFVPYMSTRPASSSTGSSPGISPAPGALATRVISSPVAGGFGGIISPASGCMASIVSPMAGSIQRVPALLHAGRENIPPASPLAGTPRPLATSRSIPLEIANGKVIVRSAVGNVMNSKMVNATRAVPLSANQIPPVGVVAIVSASGNGARFQRVTGDGTAPTVRRLTLN